MFPSIFLSAPARRTVAEGLMVEHIARIGWPYEALGEALDAVRSLAALALQRWVNLGLPFETAADGQRLFDHAEVLNFPSSDRVRGQDRFFADNMVASRRRMTADFHPGHHDLARPPPAPGTLPPRRFSVTLRRVFNLEGFSEGDRVRLRLPLPLEDAALRDLSVEALAPIETEARLSRAPGRLDAILSGAIPPTASLGARLRFTAYPAAGAPPTAALSAEEAALYTRPQEGLINVSPRIVALAADLAGSETDPHRLMQRFWDFVLDHLNVGVIHYDEGEAADMIETALRLGWSDCQAGTALLISLCRARGMPARLVSGYQLYATNPSLHYWCEVWFADTGWTPFDLLAWPLSRGGRDAAWRPYFFGAVDYRLKVEAFPRLFTGQGSVRLPRRWRQLHSTILGGGAYSFVDAVSGVLAYRDEVCVRFER
jgi:hypothetical protein